MNRTQKLNHSNMLAKELNLSKKLDESTLNSNISNKKSVQPHQPRHRAEESSSRRAAKPNGAK